MGPKEAFFHQSTWLHTKKSKPWIQTVLRKDIIDLTLISNMFPGRKSLLRGLTNSNTEELITGVSQRMVYFQMQTPLLCSFFFFFFLPPIVSSQVIDIKSSFVFGFVVLPPQWSFFKQTKINILHALFLQEWFFWVPFLPPCFCFWLLLVSL